MEAQVTQDFIIQTEVYHEVPLLAEVLVVMISAGRGWSFSFKGVA